MYSNTISISAAFIAGLAGSAHCFGMCGGIAGALGMRARTTGHTAAAALFNAGGYHTGRIGGYTFAGLLFGFAGARLQSILDMLRIGAALRVASGVLLILLALRILIRWNALAVLERLGARFWSKLQPLAHQAATSSRCGQALLLGFLWGWLPCGLVYSMLMFAAMGAGALHGASVMAAFGVGTLPAMLTSSLIASQLQRFLSQRWPRVVSAVLLIVFGLWIIATPLMHAARSQHAH